MQKGKAKTRTIKLSEKEIVAITKVIRSVLNEGYIQDDPIDLTMVGNFVQAYHKINKVADAISGNEQKSMEQTADYVFAGIERLLDRQYLIEDLATDEDLDGYSSEIRKKADELQKLFSD